MGQTFSCLALQGWFDIDSAAVVNEQSAANKRQNLRSTYLLHQHYLEDPLICSVSAQVHHLRETHVRRLCRCMNLTSLRDTSKEYQILNFGQLFRSQIKKIWGHQVYELVLGYHRIYSFTLCWSNFTMGCHTMVNHFTALHLLSVRDMITR